MHLPDRIRHSTVPEGQQEKRWSFRYLGVLLAGFLFAPGNALADFSGNHGDGYGHMMAWGDGGGMMLFGPVMMIGLVVIIVLIVISLLQRKHQSEAGGGHATTSAIAMLNERYAKGEIDHDEYEERKRRIMG